MHFTILCHYAQKYLIKSYGILIYWHISIKVFQYFPHIFHIHCGEPVKSLSVYSLPRDYHTCLDDNCWLCISITHESEQYEKYQNYAYCELNFDECNEELVRQIKDMLLSFIGMEECEIFTMDKSKVPYNYVFKGMGEDIRKYPTLNILQKTYRN